LKFSYEDILPNGISFQLEHYQGTLLFYQGWRYTHGLTLSYKGGKEFFHGYVPRDICTLVLKELESKKHHIFAKILEILNIFKSYKTATCLLEYYFTFRDSSAGMEEILKSLYLTLSKFPRKQEKIDRVRSLIEELVGLKEISEDSKWLKRLRELEKKIFWKRLLKKEWQI